MAKKQKALSKKDKAMIWRIALRLAKSDLIRYDPQGFVASLKAARLCLNQPVKGRRLSKVDKAQIWDAVLWKVETVTAGFDFHAWAEQLKAARLELAVVETEE